MKKRRVRLLLSVAIVVLLAVFGYSVYRLLSAQQDYSDEAASHDALLTYKPKLPSRVPQPSGSIGPEPEKPDSWTSVSGPSFPWETEVPAWTENESIVALQQEHPNALGWITVPGTEVDYPFTQSSDNSYYLRRDLDGNYLYAGIPFLDYRCAEDFSSGNSIIYGHNLRNGSMFGTLERFKDEAFFREHREFYVFQRNKTIQAEIIACIVLRAQDAGAVYVVTPPDDFRSALATLARHSVDLSALPADSRYITLSTCDYETDDGRVILIGRIVSTE